MSKFLVALSYSLAVTTFTQAAAAGSEGRPNPGANDRPNIILILADDLGWTDLACFGSRFYETPNIDALCRQGMKFTNAYTNAPNCAPTRACLISGRYTPRHGIYTVNTGARGLDKFRKMIPVENRTDLPKSEVTLADALRTAGYRTGMFGKWHLGNSPEYHPSARGFDVAIVTRGSHFAPGFRTNPQVPVQQGTYLADFLTEQAVSFIEQNRDRPFFLYLPHFAVHTPIQAKQTLTARFRDKPPDRRFVSQAVIDGSCTTARESCSRRRKPPFWRPAGGHDDPVYAAMIASVDESVGRITAKLDELKLAENTIVVFYSDNGGHGGYGSLGGPTGRNITDNAPLRGGKGMLYEGGIRVPLIIRWPRVVAADSLCSEPVIGIDFYPTFLEVATRLTGGFARKRSSAVSGRSAADQPSVGAPAAAGGNRHSGGRGNPDHELDGESIVPLLRGSPSATLERDAVFWHFPGYLQSNVQLGTWRTTPAGAIRSGPFKLVEFFEDGRVELYNLKEDIGESRDLASSMPGKAAELKQRLHAWRASVNAPMPVAKGDAAAKTRGR